MSDDSTLLEALRAARVGAWAWDIEANEVRWSRGVEALFGLEPHEFGGTYEDYLALLDDDARNAIRAAVGACLAGEQSDYLVEHPIELPDGRRRWLECRGSVTFEGGRPRRMFGTVADVSERHEAQTALENEQALKSAVLSTSVTAVVVLDRSGQIVYANDRAESILGLEHAEILQRRYDDPEWKTTTLDGAPWPEHEQPFVRVLESGEPLQGVRQAIQWPSGERKVLAINGAPIKDADGNVTSVVFSLQDLTLELSAEAKRKQLEEQLLHAQKLDSLGRLAGGVAHDFNNLLTAIQSYAELAQRRLPEVCPISPELTEITRTVQRAAELTGQLLAFARKQPPSPRVVSARRQVEGIADLLRRTVGERVELALELSSATLGICVDPGQLEQTLLNLAVNARDAMPHGGRLTLSTQRVTAEEAQAELGLAPRPYVRISVRDGGVGMDEATLARVFEPFFTTKGPGRGTGLGLATCHGLVRQNGGEIRIQSRLGSGTRVDLLFPEEQTDPPETCEAPRPGERSAGKETVLLVEDEAAVRNVAREALESMGYVVLAAADANEAMNVVKDHQGALDLLLTDVMLPGDNGVQLASALRGQRPDLCLLFVSGYADDILQGHELQNAEFLPKPYGPEELGRAVRRALARLPAGIRG